MQVIVPYAPEVHPTTKQVLDSYKLNVQYIDVSVYPYTYIGLLRAIWAKRAPVIIVEHDIVPWPRAIEELWECPCKWGAYSYRMHGGIGIFHGFGCTKITPAIMNALPHLWDGDVVPWNELDQRLLFAARNVGFEPHHHRPPVVHLSTRH
jgi:hypothetical protein